MPDTVYHPGMVLTTPFHERLAPLNQTQLWSHWSGYLSAVKYQMADKFEYFAVRNSAGLIDTSPLYKYRFGGRDAAKFLGGVLARDIGACRDGQAQYTLWLDERGYVVEDGVVIRFAADDFILTSAEPNLAYFQRPRRLRPGRDHRRLRRLRLVGGAGPAVARDPGIARSADRRPRLLPPWPGQDRQRAGARVADRLHRRSRLRALGRRRRRGRDVGRAVPTAVHGRGVLPVGQSALLMTRIEAGLILIGVDFHSSRFAFNDEQCSTPIELGLRLDVPRPRRLDAARSSAARRSERELADKTSRWRMVGLIDRLARLGSPLRRRRADPAEGRDADRVRDDAVRRRLPLASATRPASCTRRCCSATSPWPGCGPIWPSPARKVNLEVTINHRYHTVAAEVTRPPLFNPPRKTA